MPVTSILKCLYLKCRISWAERKTEFQQVSVLFKAATVMLLKGERDINEIWHLERIFIFKQCRRGSLGIENN